MSIPKGYKLVPVEPTDEIIRSMLAVRWPATYRNTLRFSGAGPATAAQCERDIAEAKEQFGAMLAAASTPPKRIYDETRERELFEAWSANHYYLGGCAVTIEDGEYKDTDMQYSWESWEARAKSVEVGDE